jgi:ligand-binding sensor domain-containing protein/two-component sensor histidine kinase
MHRQLHVEDGLAQSQVNAILEASDGHVWFGTFGGVSRWDGTRFENFQRQEGLAGLDVRAFHETAGGDILVSTADNGICRYRDGGFTTISTAQGLPAVSTRGFHLAADGRLYVATADGLFIFADESLDLSTARHELPGVRISGFADRRAGGFYLSTFSDGVLVWDGTTAKALVDPSELPGRIIRAVHEEPDGTVLISVYHAGVWTWRDGVLAPFVHNGMLAGHDVMAFAPASDGALYLPTLDGGVAVCRGSGCEMLTTANGLADNTSWAVHEGFGGTVYFGTWDGVSIYHPGRFLTLDKSTGLQVDSVTATAELPDGTFAVATVGGGVSFFDGEKVVRSLGTADGLEHDRVWSLLAARDGSLYIGTHLGLDRWQDGRVTTVFHEAEAPHGRIYDLHEAADGTLWLATYGGIRKVVDGRPESIYDEPDARRSSVYAVGETRAGDMLFGTAAGLVVVSHGEVLPPVADSPLADMHIWCIHQGQDGTIYLGTNGDGLWLARQGLAAGAPLEVLRTADGLSSDTIFGMAEDAAGRLCLATQRGVNIVEFKADTVIVRQLHSTDGLAGEECNPGGCFGDSRGRFWFGTIRGGTCYDPARDLPVTRPPRVHWRWVRLFGEELPLGRFAGTPVFAHGDNFLHFDFVGANPRAPDKVRYRHRLSGIDRGWVEDRENSIAYNSLPAATYLFEVMACNEWGFWSEPVSLGFRITPPFWQTWWFVLLAVLAGAGPVVLVAYNRVRHLLAYEQLRTKIAADLHDDIGAGLTEISIVSRVLAQKLPAGERALVQGELGQLGETSRLLVRSMSDIVWLVHPQRDSLRDLVTRLADANQQVFRAADIDFRVEGLAAIAELKLGVERRQHIFLLFKEAINNAVKYSGCRELRLAIAVDRNRLTMSLRDNGAGFAVAAAGQGNGLRNMRERARLLGGELTVESAPGEGCTLTLRCGIRSR